MEWKKVVCSLAQQRYLLGNKWSALKELVLERLGVKLCPYLCCAVSCLELVSRGFGMLKYEVPYRSQLASS